MKPSSLRVDLTTSWQVVYRNTAHISTKEEERHRDLLSRLDVLQRQILALPLFSADRFPLQSRWFLLAKLNEAARIETTWNLQMKRKHLQKRPWEAQIRVNSKLENCLEEAENAVKVLQSPKHATHWQAEGE